MHTAGRKMTNKFKIILRICREHFSSLFFPRRCLVCDEILEPEEQEYGIHSACKSKLHPIKGAVCMHCGRPFGDINPREFCYECVKKGYDKRSNIVQIKSLFRYKGVIKNAMYRFKYSNKREYASYFAQVAVQEYGAWFRQIGVDVIVPVPMYPKKQRKRGYNQAACFAKELSHLLDVPTDTNLVKRIVDTTPQKNLDAKERKNNLKNAFQIIKYVVQYRCVLVVDDIYTTGSTAEAVAHELIKQGTRRVYLLTICTGGDM